MHLPYNTQPARSSRKVEEAGQINPDVLPTRSLRFSLVLTIDNSHYPPRETDDNWNCCQRGIGELPDLGQEHNVHKQRYYNNDGIQSLKKMITSYYYFMQKKCIVN